MKQIKIFGLALVAMFALVSAAMATSAMAVEVVLPDIHIALGEAFPVKASGEIKAEPLAAKLETALKEPIIATSVKAELEATALVALGPLILVFKGTKQKTTECLGEGEAKETITVKGEYHLLDKLFENKLALFLLALFPELKLVCGKLKITVIPPAITRITGVTDMVDTTTFGTQPKCVGAGKQEFTEFENDAGENKTKQLLLANLGLGKENACEQFEKELVLTSNKMIEFLF
ncbi:MAG TPA: hypothetical protein VHW67_14090 [Solirubrobacteraceae bacterium]|jgi:hypothetical protein|nr:hypothetical protein [Solirubrobacteraceae bacterium]